MSTGVAIVAVDVSFQDVQFPPGTYADNKRCVYVPVCCPGDGSGTPVPDPSVYDLVPGTFDILTRTYDKGVVGYLVEYQDVHIPASEVGAVGEPGCIETCNRTTYCSDFSYVGPCVDVYGNVTEDCKLYPRRDRLCIDVYAPGAGITTTTRFELRFNDSILAFGNGIPNGYVCWSRGGTEWGPDRVTIVGPIFESASGPDIVISFQCLWKLPPSESPANGRLRLGGVVGATAWLRNAAGDVFIYGLAATGACVDSSGFSMGNCAWTGAGTGDVWVWTGAPPPLPIAGTIVVNGPFVCDSEPGDDLVNLTRQAVDVELRDATSAEAGTVRNPIGCCGSGSGGGSPPPPPSPCDCGPTAGAAAALYDGGEAPLSGTWVSGGGGTLTLTVGDYAITYDPSLCGSSPSGVYTLSGPGYGPFAAYLWDCGPPTSVYWSATSSSPGVFIQF